MWKLELGETYEVGQPETVGTISKRTELLHTPDPSAIKWGIRYSGEEILKGGKPITVQEDLQIGDRVTTWDSDGWVVTGSTTIKKGDHVYGHLSFDKDNRHSWVCDDVSVISKSLISHLNITR